MWEDIYVRELAGLSEVSDFDQFNSSDLYTVR